MHTKKIPTGQACVQGSLNRFIHHPGVHMIKKSGYRDMGVQGSLGRFVTSSRACNIIKSLSRVPYRFAYLLRLHGIIKNRQGSLYRPAYLLHVHRIIKIGRVPCVSLLTTLACRKIIRPSGCCPKGPLKVRLPPPAGEILKSSQGSPARVRVWADVPANQKCAKNV